MISMMRNVDDNHDSDDGDDGDDNNNDNYYITFERVENHSKS